MTQRHDMSSLPLLAGGDSYAELLTAMLVMGLFILYLTFYWRDK